jgi:uncharacterized protein (DUF433 family)
VRIIERAGGASPIGFTTRKEFAMKKFLASAVGASVFGAGALGLTPFGMTAGVAQAAERPASTPAEAAPGPTLVSSLLDVARAELAVGDQNDNDQGDVTGTVGDVTGTVHGHGQHGGPHLSGMLATIAGVIGIPEADLVAALQSGQSIAQIATAHNVDPQKVIDALVAAARSKLDAAVAAGMLTQAQEDQMLAIITDAITRLVNTTPPGFGENGPPGPTSTATAA